MRATPEGCAAATALGRISQNTSTTSVRVIVETATPSSGPSGCDGESRRKRGGQDVRHVVSEQNRDEESRRRPQELPNRGGHRPGAIRIFGDQVGLPNAKQRGLTPGEECRNQQADDDEGNRTHGESPVRTNVVEAVAGVVRLARSWILR